MEPTDPQPATLIVFLDSNSLPPGTTLRSPDFPHRMVAFEKTAPEEVAERIADAEIVITNKVPVRAVAIEGARKLRMIAVSATGTDVVDLDACSARGIAVSNVADYARTTVPEHTFALIFALRRSLLAYHDSVRQGRWQTATQFCFFDHPIADLAGSTIGIIGRGALGASVGDIASALGMKVLFAGRKGEPAGDGYTPFEEVLRRSDVITIHTPLTPDTKGIIGANEFALMERRPILVNTARGGLVDEAALGEALESGRIAGAGFDVASQEPPPADHPLMALLEFPNFILTPHVAWASREASQVLADQTIANIEAFRAGKPRNVVNP